MDLKMVWNFEILWQYVIVLPSSSIYLQSLLRYAKLQH